MLTVIEILGDCQLFADVPPRSFQRLAAMARLCRFRKGQTVFRQDEDCPGVYVVGKGMVRIFKTGPGGKEHVLHIVGPGGTFAEVAALGNLKTPAAAEAVQATVCTLLPQAAFRKALEEDHPLCLGMLTGLTGWVRHLVGLLEDVVLRDAAGRIARYLLAARPAADGTIALPSLKRHVASHLNLTSETFSRTLRRLLDAGLIAQPDKNRVRLLSRDRLRRVAEGMSPKF
ncbi:MAG: Crp/Fnr family transcriptional regulator [Thermoguttaceae bacterium]